MSEQLNLLDRLPAMTGPFAARPLPERVRVLSLWQPYAGLAVRGTLQGEERQYKTLETRKWEWPYEPGWLCVHVALHVDREAVDRLGALAAPHYRKSPRGRLIAEPGGVLLGLVWVAGCRPLLPEDEYAACFYAPDRFAWLLETPLPFPAPVPMRGPQKFSSVERDVVLRALGGVS